MALSYDKIRELPGVQRVGGNLIVGILEDAITLGRTDDQGVFTLTKAGEEYLAKLESKPKKSAKKGAEAAADVPAADDAAE